MKKGKFNSEFRDFASTLSPTVVEREMISKIYLSICELLGEDKCLQIGSYPRFTSITPVHDLDILFIIGVWNANSHSPQNTLEALSRKLATNYVNPTRYSISIDLQTHSVTITFSEQSKEVFSVDIVPAYTHGKNEFLADKYKVPEIIKRRHGRQRKEYYQRLSLKHMEMGWIDSDPRGYIQIAANVDNNSNGNFRKAAKLIKLWKHNLANQDEELKLKSFHLEQVITAYFLAEPTLQIFDSIFRFFYELPLLINNPNKIADRANSDKYIDDYLSELSDSEKRKIIQARDGFLSKLELFQEEDLMSELFEILFLVRASASEQYLFDRNIPVLTQDSLCINGWIQMSSGQRRLSSTGVIDQGYQIKFEPFMGPQCDHYKWKVKNDNSSADPRGEICDYTTKNNPERTAYTGKHFVECYAILNNECIARSRQYVIILDK